MLLFVIAVSVAIVVSCLCSLSEASLLSIGHGPVERLAQQGTKAGRLLRQFKRHPDEAIAAILILNTVAHTAGASLAGAQFGEAFPGVAEWWFVATFTVVILLFTEILPKIVGVVHGQRIALPVAVGVGLAVRMLRPVIWVTKGISRLVGGGGNGHSASLEEIRLLATAGLSQGLFGELTAGIIANATRLRDTRARDVMVPRNRIAYLSGTRSTKANLDVVRRSGHSRFLFTPDGELDHVSGVILTKELAFSLRDHPEPDWQELLVPLVVVPETAALNHVLRAFQREKRHLAIVVDEYGGVQGIVTLEDVLEEIVGEIQDELDDDERHVLERPDGTLLCRGFTETRRLFERLGLRNVESSSQTLSGFLTERLGRVPDSGAEFELDGYRFTVLRANNKRAERVRIDRIKGQGDIPAPPASPGPE